MTPTSTRKSLTIAASIFAAILPFTVAAANAQTSRPVAVVKVPFAFEAGSKHLQPGTYTISVFAESVLLVKGNTNRDAVMTLARWNDDTKASASTRVVFHHYGDKYFLREIWGTNQASHIESLQTSAETRMRKARTLNIASNGSIAPAVEVVLAADQN